MTLETLGSRARAGTPFAAAALMLLLIALSLARHLGDEGAAERASLARFQRIAADLPRLERMASSLPSRTSQETAPANPSLAAATWQSELGRLAAAHDLELASAEPLLDKDGAASMPQIALELVGHSAGLLAFLYEVEHATIRTRITRLEIAPTGEAKGGMEPPLSVRLQAVLESAAP